MLLQSVTGITKCGSYYWVWQKVFKKCDIKSIQGLADITKCDKNLLEHVTNIKKCDNYYKVRHNNCLTFSLGLKLWIF